ncbi:MAG: sigma 54-interacting transcriptional regulator [Candidatus Zixiibacteriota bacterium]|nr:MAG: sigma 54-interacting transcriptional regulator [candidate division Zixibacteria bacterium]
MDFEKDKEFMTKFCHSTVEQGAFVIFWISPDGSVSRVNNPACTFLGYQENELISLTVSDIVDDLKKNDWMELLSELKESKKKLFESKMIKKDGSTIPVEIDANYLEYEDDIFICFFVHDIIERRQIEQLLRKSESNLAEAQRLAHLGSWHWNIETNELLWSDEIYRIFGLTPKEFGATYEAFLASVHPDDREYVMKSVDEALQDDVPYDIEHRVVQRKGDIRVVNERAEVTFNSGGRAIRMIGTVQDITERKQAEEALRNALEEVEKLKSRLQAENIYLQEEIKVGHNFDDIISRNQKLKGMLRKVEQVASTTANVLILGETGTGKELVARAIHNISDRRDRPLVKVNCAALPANLIESELFGHEKGAFTGALSRKIGRFELADKGTIFLDEIADLPLDLQSKLLRVLQEGEFERLGNPSTIKVNVRVIAATNRDLEEDVKNNSFREDLYYRLNVFPIKIPPLRERKDDIPLLVKYFTKKYSAKIGKKIETIPAMVMENLQAYDWPGNVRELENVVERATILSNDETLRVDDLPPDSLNRGDEKQVYSGSLEQVEKDHILAILKECNWIIDGVRGAARRLDIPASTLRDRMKKLDIKRPK